MGYEYKQGGTGERANKDIGRVYRVVEGSDKDRLMAGDLMLCLQQSGDSHFDYVRLELRTSNDTIYYYTVEERYSGYGRGWEPIKEMRPFNHQDLVAILFNGEALIHRKSIEPEAVAKRIEIKEKMDELKKQYFEDTGELLI